MKANMKSRLYKLLAVLLACALQFDAHAEYGDVVINSFAEEAGMRAVVFPHWFHRIRFTCKVCHLDLDFELEAGGSQIQMVDILEGRYCGACHNEEIAWGIENCDLCHSAKPDTKTQVHRRSLRGLSGAKKAPTAGKKTAVKKP